MYDRKFFRSKLGRASLFSIAAMLALNVVALREASSAPTFESAVAAAEQA